MPQASGNEPPVRHERTDSATTRSVGRDSSSSQARAQLLKNPVGTSHFRRPLRVQSVGTPPPVGPEHNSSKIQSGPPTSEGLHTLLQRFGRDFSHQNGHCAPGGTSLLHVWSGLSLAASKIGSGLLSSERPPRIWLDLTSSRSGFPFCSCSQCCGHCIQKHFSSSQSSKIRSGASMLILGHSSHYSRLQGRPNCSSGRLQGRPNCLSGLHSFLAGTSQLFCRQTRHNQNVGCPNCSSGFLNFLVGRHCTFTRPGCSCCRKTRKTKEPRSFDVVGFLLNLQKSGRALWC